MTGYAGKLAISGGTVMVNSSYGEGLEVKGDLTFDGGETYIHSGSDDAMDSNGNTKLNGGYWPGGW